MEGSTRCCSEGFKHSSAQAEVMSSQRSGVRAPRVPPRHHDDELYCFCFLQPLQRHLDHLRAMWVSGPPFLYCPEGTGVRHNLETSTSTLQTQSPRKDGIAASRIQSMSRFCACSSPPVSRFHSPSQVSRALPSSPCSGSFPLRPSAPRSASQGAGHGLEKPRVRRPRCKHQSCHLVNVT